MDLRYGSGFRVDSRVCCVQAVHICQQEQPICLHQCGNLQGLQNRFVGAMHNVPTCMIVCLMVEEHQLCHCPGTGDITLRLSEYASENAVKYWGLADTAKQQHVATHITVCV